MKSDGTGAERQLELAVMLMTMDMPPFDLIFEEGPRRTWMRQLPAGAAVIRYSGLPMSARRRPWSAVRERLRFLGRNRVNMNIAGRATWLTRLTDQALCFAFPPTNAARLAASWALRLLARLVELAQWLWGRLRLRRAVVQEVEPLTVRVERVQSLSNMLDIQLEAFAWAQRVLDPDGFLVITLSTYLDPERALRWHRTAVERGVDFASMPSTYSGGRLFSGGCMYFSRNGMSELIRHDRALSRGVLNDVAITRWLSRSGCTWEDLPVHSLSQIEGMPDNCPLCDDADVFAVRCTSHRNRLLELERMRALDAHGRSHA